MTVIIRCVRLSLQADAFPEPRPQPPQEASSVSLLSAWSSYSCCSCSSLLSAVLFFIGEKMLLVVVRNVIDLHMSFFKCKPHMNLLVCLRDDWRILLYKRNKTLKQWWPLGCLLIQ